jgi:hypothetical protein
MAHVASPPRPLARSPPISLAWVRKGCCYSQYSPSGQRGRAGRQVPADQQQECAHALLRVLEAVDDPLRFFEILIKQEVEATVQESPLSSLGRLALTHKACSQLDAPQETTLFRTNSMATKMLSKYAHMLSRTYLSQVLRPLIDEVLLKPERSTPPSRQLPLRHPHHVLGAQLRGGPDAARERAQRVRSSSGRCRLGPTPTAGLRSGAIHSTQWSGSRRSRRSFWIGSRTLSRHAKWE